MAIFLASPASSVASLPPGVTAYLASLVLCLSLHPAIASLMSRSAHISVVTNYSNYSNSWD